MVVALPGVDLKVSVEGGDLAAFGSSDARYAKIQERQTGAKEYLSKFRTPFGLTLEPTVIGKPARVERVPSDWISEFRLLVSVPHVIRGRVDWTALGLGSGPPYSELFDVYPVILAKDPEYVTIQAPGETGLHVLSKFEGSYPFTVTTNPKDFTPENDDDLCAALIALWQTKPTDSARHEFRSRVFRSLAMADYALRGLYANFGSAIDIGIPLSLWTGAFEAIAAPDTGEVKTRHVADLIARIPWEDERLRSAEHEPTHFRPDPPGSAKVTLPVQVYGRVASLRNELLHGRTLPADTAARGRLSVQVPVLYRCTLLYLLAEQGFGAFPSDWLIQDWYEEALLEPPPEDGRR